MKAPQWAFLSNRYLFIVYVVFYGAISIWMDLWYLRAVAAVTCVLAAVITERTRGNLRLLRALDVLSCTRQLLYFCPVSGVVICVRHVGLHKCCNEPARHLHLDSIETILRRDTSWDIPISSIVEPDEFASIVAEYRRRLFTWGNRVLHSGAAVDWIIDCDVLTRADLDCLAHLAFEMIGPWGEVEGVPQGGLRFAEACRELAVAGERLLVVDDVCTTGASLEVQRAGRDAGGLVIFARGPVPDWAKALFQIDPVLAVGRGTP